MSKFIRSKDQDSSSSSSEESVDEDQKKQHQQHAQKAKNKKFYGDDDDVSDEEQKTAVKSGIEKKTENITAIFAKTKNHTKISDFMSLQNDLDEIITEMGKCIGVAFATDNYNTLPRWVLKELINIEDCVLDVTAEYKKKMNKKNRKKAK